jgi:predicted enzyme related to lactoylglutathione lyase
MAQGTNVGRPTWVDLSTSDAAAARDFYARLFGWQVVVNPDPQYGGYALAKVGGKDVAGIGPAMSPGAPTAWSFYIGTDDAEALGGKVQAAGGTVVMPAFPVGDQGRMAVFQDSTGAFISAWEPQAMAGFESGGANMFGWAELNARGLERAVPFYESVFGWTHRSSDTPGMGAYVEFLDGGETIAGAMEVPPMVPAEIPGYWLVYFNVDDVDAAVAKVLASGGREMVAPRDFAGGRFAVLGDPQGAAFGLLRMSPR